MNEKYASIQRMKELMRERRLKNVFLLNPLHTHWPGDDRPFTISEAVYHADDNRLVFWQHWDKSDVGHNIESYDDSTVLTLEKRLSATVDSLKRYSVKVTATIDIMATSPENAGNTVKHMDSDDRKENIYWIFPTDEIKEK